MQIFLEIKDNYFVTNLRVGYSLLNSFTPYVELRNLTDTNYQEILGANLPRRWWKVGVIWNW